MIIIAVLLSVADTTVLSDLIGPRTCSTSRQERHCTTRTRSFRNSSVSLAVFGSPVPMDQYEKMTRHPCPK